MLPAIIIQYIFFKCSIKCVYSDCCVNVWAKIPFIYGLPVFTGIFTSLKVVKNHQTRENEDLGHLVLQVSEKARLFYQLTRVITTTTFLTVIWWIPNLRVLRAQHFAYLHVVNGVELIFGVLLPVSRKLWDRYCCLDHCSNFRPIRLAKYGIFDPLNDRTTIIRRKGKNPNLNNYILAIYIL